MKDEEYPTVTEIIYTILPLEYDVDEFYVQRGIYVHKAIELLLKNNLDETSLDDIIKPYVEEFKEFQKIINLQVIDLEKRFYNHRLKFSGKPDIIGTINGVPAVIDIKSSQTEAIQWRLQTAAYSELTDIKTRYIIYRKQNGGWRLLEHKDKTDIYTFYSCLSIYNFLKKNNKLVERK